MADAVVAIRKTINDVTSTVGHAKSSWTGSAYNACVTASSSWEDEADRLKGILQRITDLVGEGNTKYTQMEADNTDYFTNSQGSNASASSPFLTNLNA